MDSTREDTTTLPTESMHIDLWKELEDELTRDGQPTESLTILRDGEAEWLRQTTDIAGVEAAMTRATERHGNYFHRVIIQGARCSTTADTLRTLGDALEFPSYYGMNWDALDECLGELLIVSNGRLGGYYGDRLGRKGQGLVLIVNGAEHLLEKEPRDATDKLFNIFGWVAGRPADPLGRSLVRGQFFVLLGRN